MEKKLRKRQADKKTILVYGDSNTWGMTDKMTRYPPRIRWTNKLQKLLGNPYEVIGAGVPGGVAGDYPQANLIKRRRNSFDIVFRQHQPVNILIVALGTNDLKDKYSRTPEQIKDTLLWYRDRLEEFNNQSEQNEPTKLLYLLPSNFDSALFSASADKRLKLNDLMKQATDLIISADNINLSSDGAHFSELGHEQMSKIVFSKIKELEND